MHSHTTYDKICSRFTQCFNTFKTLQKCYKKELKMCFWRGVTNFSSHVTAIEQWGLGTAYHSRASLSLDKKDLWLLSNDPFSIDFLIAKNETLKIS